MSVTIRNYYCKDTEKEAVETIIMTTYINNVLMFPDKTNITKLIITKAGKDDSDEDADAICGCPLAAQLNCPLLTVQSNSSQLPQEVKNFISSIPSGKLDTIYIVGEEISSVKDSVIGNSSNYDKKDYVVNGVTIGKEYTLKSSHTESNTSKLLHYCSTVKRLYGNDRYNTAAAVAYELRKEKEANPMRLFYCYGLDMADGYCISAAACRLKEPLLFMPEEEPDPNTIYGQYIRAVKGNIKKVFITGGGQRVFIETSKRLQNILGLTMPNCIERIAGRDRLDTSLSIAKEFRDYLDPNEKHSIVIINSNAVEVDLPIVGYFAAKKQYPVILIDMGTIKEESIAHPESTSTYLKFNDYNYDLTPFLLKRLPTNIYLFSNYPINKVSTARTNDQLKNDLKKKSLKSFNDLANKYNETVYSEENDSYSYTIYNNKVT